MLKILSILSVLIIFAIAATVPQDNGEVLTVVDTQPVATTAYQFGYNDGQSTRAETRDTLGNVIGTFSYIGTDGVIRSTYYTAGADGYKILAAPQFGTPTPVASSTSTGNGAPVASSTGTAVDTATSTGLQDDSTFLTAPITPLYGRPSVVLASGQPQPATQYGSPPASTSVYPGYVAPAVAPATTTTNQVVKLSSSPYVGYQPVSSTQYVTRPVSVSPYVGSTSYIPGIQLSPVTQTAGYPAGQYSSSQAVSASYTPGYQLNPVAQTAGYPAGQYTGYQYPPTQYSGHRTVPASYNLYRYV